MKNDIIKAILGLIAVAALFASCGRDVDSGTTIEIYAPASTDLATGGSWKTLLLTDAAQVAVETPEAPASAAYRAELLALKNQSAPTDAQKKLIAHWSANSVARWNEIARELAAKYNLPPAANADGTYPVPSAANPSQYPLFPFANPPYASRAFAHVSAAIFDALIVCWKAKQEHGRLAPYRNDASIEPLVPKTDLPSYPSEDAVVAAAAREALSFFFPNEKEYLKNQAEDCKNARLFARANVQSDLAAGDSLGRRVAAFAIARAKSDGMGKALGTKHDWDSLALAQEARGEIAWKSLETPARPPMLPFFGNVKPWLIGPAAQLAPGPPPSINSQQFKDELAEVRSTVQNITAEQRRIAMFWSDGPSTYTPPGHWNRTACELAISAHMNLLRTARVFAYVNTAMADAAIVCWRTKCLYYNPRPSQMDPSIKTFLGVPNFPSFISGHSTFSAAAAETLGHIFPSEKTRLDALAREASLSRLYGGIHYRSDCETGLAVGQKCGQASVDRALIDGAE